MTETNKRQGGQINANGNWLVLEDESTRHDDGGWLHKCGTEIMAQRVHHPIHDGPFALSGSGRVHVEEVPFCPECETAPSSAGAPITPGETE